GSMRFGEVKFETIKKHHKFEVQIFFNDLDPNTTQVQLFANGINGEAPVVHKMRRGAKLKGTTKGYNYNGSVAATRPATDFTPRAIPFHPNVSVPLEISRILWQR
ncbi:MAG: DUF3417 domain-containing protein, partial [Bacteroidota bacterium]